VSESNAWADIILDARTPKDAWALLFGRLKELAVASKSPVVLHRSTVDPDRLLSEAAWELWAAYLASAARTSDAITEWCGGDSPTGRAVLVLDALSLRELPFILGGAEAHGIKPVGLRVTGAEAPSTTECFAEALGAFGRNALANDGKPKGFTPFKGAAFTDVLSLPFADCVNAVPSQKNLFIWHTWLDDLLHVQKRLPDQIYALAATELQSDGFWKFVNRLRTGRKLVITSDHGYAVSKLFSSEVEDADAVQALRDIFGASRYKASGGPWNRRCMPPVVLTIGDHLVVMGQRKWRAPGGFPHVCHGGLSLLEVAVPFIELPPF
jgi:hypothetical protein